VWRSPCDFFSDDDTRMVEKHSGHLVPSHLADAIRAGAPKFALALNPTVTMLRR
jgi:hypothetical protein